MNEEAKAQFVALFLHGMNGDTAIQVVEQVWGEVGVFAALPSN